MATSICVLGFGDLGQSLVKKLKSYENYGDNFRVHCIHVRDSKAKKYEALTTTIEYGNENWLQVLADGTETNEATMTPIGNDLEWLLNSEGHNVVVNCMSRNDESVKLIFDLIAKGNKFYYIFLDSAYEEYYAKDIESLVKVYGGNINYKPAEYLEIDEKVDATYRAILDIHDIEVQNALAWEQLSAEEKLEKEALWAAEEEKRLKAVEQEKLRLTGEPCGLEDRFSWSELDK